MKPFSALLLAVLTTGSIANAASAPSYADQIKAIRAVGPEGKGNAEATAAWKKLSSANAASLTTILAAMDGANDLALNWLRSAVDTVAGREEAAGRKLPVADLKKFLADTSHHPRARRLAYELIAKADPASAASLLPTLREDPSTELRREAIQQLIDQATALTKAGNTNGAVPVFQSALRLARDVDQVDSIAKELKTAGQTVDLPAVFGWLTDWKAIGPFDNTGRAGFATVFPPEQSIDPNAELDGKTGKARWVELKTKDDYGIVDLNKPFGDLKEVTGYATTTFHSDKAKKVELRLGSQNGWKIWLNGKELFGRDEYHRNMEIDQYRVAADLKAGPNVILVKVCQNEQKEEWTKNWNFQLRVTDAIGTPIAQAKP